MEGSESHDMILGRLLSGVEAIDRKVERLITDTSSLEKRVDILENENAKRVVPNQYLDRLLWAAVAAGGTAAATHLGPLVGA